MRTAIRVKRAYAAPEPDDGCRVLVDRLWPRGVAREAAHFDLWLKEIAPSAGLRLWFNHDAARWDEFQRRYFAELEQQPEPLEQLVSLIRKGRVTLVYGAKDELRNNAVALKAFLESRLRK